MSIRRPLSALLTTAVAAVGVAALPGKSGADPSTQTVTYQGYAVDVPASWRVVDLDRNPRACVIFDRSTVYLGQAGEEQDCPAHAVGGAPSLWIQPLDQATARAAADRDAPVIATGAATSVRPDHNGESAVVVEDAGVVVTSYGGASASSLLGSAALTSAATPADARLVDAAAEPSNDGVVTPMAKVPGEFVGRGFDACAAPGGKAMHAWKNHSTFRSVGIYIGGVSRACAQPHLTREWVQKRVKGHWHLLPIQVGPQAPCTGFSHRLSSNPQKARDEGRGSAQAAVRNAKQLGISERSVLYYDMEGYNNSNRTCRKAVLAFLTGWTNRLHQLNYRSGVYSSISSGISDLSDTYRSKKWARPNHIWAAWWNGKRNVDFSGYGIPDRQWNKKQRVHQYRGGHDETHGGYTINIDSNYMKVH